MQNFIKMTKTTSFKIAIFLFLTSVGLLFFRKPLTLYLAQAFLKGRAYDLASKAKIRQISQQTGEWMVGAPQAIFLNQKVASPLAQFPKEKRVLGEETGQEKWIEVDLSDQRLKAWQGNRLVYDFAISSGKWAPTPEGNFRIWVKLRYSLMQGGSKEDGTYYYLPNVPYVMYFYGGYGIHGTYWHNNFGVPMSHGCVNLSIPDAGVLFTWADPYIPPDKWVAYPSKENPGTKVVIHQ